MISLLQFTNAVARGGAEEHVLMLLRGLDRKLFRLYFACTPALAERVAADVPKDVELIRVDLQQPYQLGQMWRFGSILRERRIQIVHSHMFYSSLCASPVAWFSGVPLILDTSHGREAWRSGPIKGRFFIDRMVSRVTRRHIAVSKANAQYLVEKKRLRENKISVIYPGSDLSRFNPDHAPPAALRESAGIAPGDPVIVFVGRLEPQKGHRVLIEAMTSVCSRHPRARLICAGEGALRAELEQQVRALGLERNVIFVGYPPDVRDWLAIADFTVLPSFYEGLPVTPIESLAAGKTVVATAVDGTPEVVINERTGLTVPPGNPGELASAICRLIADPDLRLRLAAEGRKWVTDTFTVQRMVAHTQDLYINAWKQRANAAAVQSGEERTLLASQ